MSIAISTLVGLIDGIAATILLEFVLKTNKNLRRRYYKHHLVVLGYHIHHSSYGLLFMTLGIFLYFNQGLQDALFYIAFGIGIIIQHTLSAGGRLVFIEKWWK